MKSIGDIYLTWRKGRSRIVVGVIKKTATDVSFSYFREKVEEAQKEGFTTYTEFPDINKTYTENVVDIFGQRLTKSERADIQKYYDFWEINTDFKDQKYYLLAHTQGLLATDNFEFLADYTPSEGLSFISEICGLSHTKPAPNAIKIVEELTWKFNRNNKFDSEAVEVYKGDFRIGNVKLIHCKVFHKPGGDKLKIWVKSIVRNGHLNRVFIKIAFSY